MTNDVHKPERNLLLSKLSPSLRRALDDKLEFVSLELRQMINERNKPITQVYFPTNGVVSMVNEPDGNGQVVEIATIGLEGLVGVPVLLGGRSMPSTAFVQIPGEAFRLPTDVLLRAADDHPEFRGLLLRYTLALLNQIAQSASCNRIHEVQERCARWLLQTHDRVTADTFPLTQEFLGQMLGVQRPTVSIAAGILQDQKLIEYNRGIITIKSRKGLEAASCRCYKLIKTEYERLLNDKS